MLILIFSLLILSASFSSFETALFSLSPVQKYRMKQAGFLSLLLTRAVSKPRELLTTVLLGNELVNVAISILAGMLAYDIFQAYGPQSVYLVCTAITTLVILIFGEIVPKNIAVRSPLIVGRALIVPYQIFSWAVFPLRWILVRIANGIVRLFGANPHQGPRMIVEEELRNLLQQGKEEGTFADLERKLIQNALDFSRVTVRHIMTPREKIIAIPFVAPFSVSGILQLIEEERHSRYPVYDGQLDQILGVLHTKELLPHRFLDIVNLKDRLKPYVEAAPDEALESLFEKFRKLKLHMAIVRSERGKVVGLITMDDLLRKFLS